jgi:hypothetical protein
VPDGDSAPRFTHSAFLCDTQAAYLPFLLPFIGEDVDRGHTPARFAVRR